MPLKTSAPASRSGGKAKGKTGTSSHSKGKAPHAKGKSTRAAHPPEPVHASWWSTLSPERKLDVVGAVMAVVGILSLLILFSVFMLTTVELLRRRSERLRGIRN